MHKGSKNAADWNLTDWCNYRCTYCTSGEGKHASREVVEQVFRFFRDVFRPDKLVLCGGEPSFHPQFPDVMGFCGDHRIEVRLDSNLSLPAPRFLAALARLDGTPIFVNATWHHEFATFDRFVRNVHTLRDAGYEVGVRLIAFSHEPVQVRDRHARLCAAGLRPDLKIEKVRRRDDPTARLPQIGASYDPTYYAWIADQSGLTPDELRAATSYNRYVGASCRAGATYLHITERGDVSRCSAYTRMGAPLGNVANFERPWVGRPDPCFAPICKCREAERFDLVSLR